MVVHLMFSHRFLRLCLFFFNSFSFSTSYCITYFYLLSSLLILSSAISNLFLSQSSECFISIIIHFNSRISILFIILNSICLKIFSFCIGFLIQMVSAVQCWGALHPHCFVPQRGIWECPCLWSILNKINSWYLIRNHGDQNAVGCIQGDERTQLSSKSSIYSKTTPQR